MSNPPPLAGLRVVDATDIRGALCARILADLGADVIRLRHEKDEPNTAAHRYRNARKQTSTTTVADPALGGLLADADVFVENTGPTGGLDRDAIAAAHPELVLVALTDFGLDGPRAGWHLEALPALASSGALHATGFPELLPTAVPGHLAHDCGSVHGALGAVAAIMDRRRTGLGQRIEISTQEAALNGTVPWSVVIPGYLQFNPYLPVEGKRNAEGMYLVFEAADGHIRVVLATPTDWSNFLEVLGRPEELLTLEWGDRLHRMLNAPQLQEIVNKALVGRTRAELFASALEHNVPLGAIQTPLEFVRHRQTTERGYFHEGLARAPWSFSAAPVTDPAPPTAPTDVGFGAERAPLDAIGSSPSLLLDGVRVVEFGIAAVVPEMCWMLSELGAEVIKIESVVKPDVLRLTGLDDLDKGFAFNMECRGRRSVALDLTTEEGRRLALDICATADVVAENNRGGVMAKLGLDHADIAAVNPDVIYVASQGYGRRGPMGDMKAYGPLNSGFAGVHLLFSHPDGEYPCGTSMNHPDHIAGKLLATAVLAALDHRRRTGEGQLVEMAQTEAAVYLVGELYLDAIETGVEPTDNGSNRHPTMAPHGVYPAAGDDEWIAISVADDAAWSALERECGWDPDPTLATVADRIDAHDVIDERLSAWTATLDPDQASARLQTAGVSALTVMGPLRQLADQHLTERGLMVDLHHDAVGPEQQPANPTRMSRTELRIAPSAPCLGAHTAEVLTEVLGLDPAEIARLDEAGVLR